MNVSERMVISLGDGLYKDAVVTLWCHHGGRAIKGDAKNVREEIWRFNDVIDIWGDTCKGSFKSRHTFLMPLLQQKMAIVVKRNMTRSRGTPLLLSVALLSYVTISLLIFAGIPQQNGEDTANFGRQHRMTASLTPCISQDADTPPRRLRYNSTDATVMAYVTGYELPVYQQFVGSLRNSGFTGHVILAVGQTLQEGVEEYLLEKNVTYHHSIPVNCTLLPTIVGDSVHHQEAKTCVHPYPELKARWSRFPLLRDYLVECLECTGPVLVTDVRDVFFQRDPFGEGSEQVEGLQVFEEYKSQTTNHKLVKGPVAKCKHMSLGNKPMLCSGTTIGTRDSMIQYLTIMEEEMRQWMKDSNCCCNVLNGDDQSIHNYLYYTKRLPFATAVPNRMGTVNTVGVQGAKIWNAHIQSRMELLITNQQTAVGMLMDGSDGNGDRWLGDHFGLTDSEVRVYCLFTTRVFLLSYNIRLILHHSSAGLLYSV